MCHILPMFDNHQSVHVAGKKTVSDPCVLGQDDCRACSLFTLNMYNHCLLVDPSVTTVIGPTDCDNMVTAGVSPVKAVSKPPDQSSSSELAEFKKDH